MKASIKRWKSYTTAEKQRIGEEGNAVYEDMLRAIPKGASSPEAQTAVERWRHHIEYFWTPNDLQLLGLADGYNNDPRFKANFDKIHPKLAGFIREAVRVYVENKKGLMIWSLLVARRVGVKPFSAVSWFCCRCCAIEVEPLAGLQAVPLLLQPQMVTRHPSVSKLRLTLTTLWCYCPKRDPRIQLRGEVPR